MNDEQTNLSPKEEKSDAGFLGAMFDYIEIFAVSIIAVLVIFSFCFRLCDVDGNSMNNTLQNGETLVTYNLFYEPQQGDIVVFHLVNDNYQRTIVKRMIADEGQEVLIDLTSKEVYVDGQLLNEEYVYLEGDTYNRFSYFDQSRISKDERNHVIFRTTVPAGKIFVMGDNRNHSTDSRSTGIGFIDKDCILGKAILRLSPLTLFH